MSARARRLACAAAGSPTIADGRGRRLTGQARSGAGNLVNARGRVRGRHLRSTMAPLSAPASARLSAPTTSGHFNDSGTRNHLNKHPITAVNAAGGRVGRAALWAARWGRARVPSKGGATPPFFTRSLDPTPGGAAPDPGGRSPFARDRKPTRRRVAIGARRRRTTCHDRDTALCAVAAHQCERSLTCR